jgi:hypothetical protein
MRLAYALPLAATLISACADPDPEPTRFTLSDTIGLDTTIADARAVGLCMLSPDRSEVMGRIERISYDHGRLPGGALSGPTYQVQDPARSNPWFISPRDGSWRRIVPCKAEKAPPDL